MRYERVLVTGGSGLLGRFVVDELAARCDVAVLDLEPPRQAVPYHPVDVLDLDALHGALRGRDAVVHLAGIDAGNPFPDKTYFETNVQGTWNVLHAAQAAGVERVVVASSIAAYGLGPDRMPDYLPVDEAHPRRPEGTYGLSKLVIEHVCEGFARRGRLALVCLRASLIVRPEKEAAILAQLALPEPDRDPAPGHPVAADGTAPYGALPASRAYVRSADAARCFRLALEHDAESFEAYNVSAHDSIGREETLARMRRVYGRLPQLRGHRFQSDPYAGVFDTARARARLGWRAEGDWTDVVAYHEASGGSA